MPTEKYLKTDTARLFEDGVSEKFITELLWGDLIQVLPGAKQNGRVKARARGKEGFIEENKLCDQSLLEVYFIDVGQGDGLLIVTPDRKHILIDGGYNRKVQPHNKSAADFVDWKFKMDYGRSEIHLDCMMSSHCDADHYGGLWDLVNPNEEEELKCENVIIDKFYHAGVSWWEKDNGSKGVGNASDGYLSSLLEDKASVEKGLEPGADPELAGNWATFLKNLISKCPDLEIKRLACNPSKGIWSLPDFRNPDGVSIKVLGPVESEQNGKTVLKDFGTDSQNTNGNSLLLRVDYGRSRILLTGDLNKASQQYILEVFKGNRQELAADVAKSCHHGSDDCSYEYLETVHASASVISSGDDETHSHPRPNIVAACGITGYKKIDNDELITPLIFCTEISRSVKMGNPYEVDYKGYSFEGQDLNIKLIDEAKTKVSYKRIASGGLNPSKMTKSMDKLRIIDGIVYGLVNVRTDGNTILCATLNEGKCKWEIKKFSSRF
jgi:beta-lactamase superfamily II metal-dependent hydrolase